MEYFTAIMLLELDKAAFGTAITERFPLFRIHLFKGLRLPKFIHLLTPGELGVLCQGRVEGI
jgi:hypothetical protein